MTSRAKRKVGAKRRCLRRTPLRTLCTYRVNESIGSLGSDIPTTCSMIRRSELPAEQDSIYVRSWVSNALDRRYAVSGYRLSTA
jgi:hypothetical protein